MNDLNNQFTSFSVLLGLTDFLNPLFMTFTLLTIMKSLKEDCPKSLRIVFKVGAIVALVGGYLIPAGKVIVGTGLVDFILPVPIVHIINTGFLVAGFTLFLYCRGRTYKSLPVWEIILLAVVYIGCFALICIVRRYNTAAVLTGAAGILLLYISLIIMSVQRHKVVPIVLVVCTICLTVFLSVVGSTWDVDGSPAVHWVIELTNAFCQCLLFIGTKVLFTEKKEQ